MKAIRPLAVLIPVSLATTCLVVALAGCGRERVAAPEVRAAAAFEATLVRLPDGSVSVHAVATNTGNVPIQIVGTGFCSSIGMRVRGSKGEIALADPCGPIPACAAPPPVAPGARIERDFVYDGRQYADTCNSLHAIPPGRYDVVAEFTWYATPGGPTARLSRSLPFDWPGP